MASNHPLPTGTKTSSKSDAEIGRSGLMQTCRQQVFVRRLPPKPSCLPRYVNCCCARFALGATQPPISGHDHDLRWIHDDRHAASLSRGFFETGDLNRSISGQHPCCRTAAERHPHLVDSLKLAPLAQWQSSGLLIRRLAVRARRGAPEIQDQNWCQSVDKTGFSACLTPILTPIAAKGQT